MTVMATKADYEHLATDFADIGRRVVVGFEANGNYHRTLAHRLLPAGFELRLISSIALARTREALPINEDSTEITMFRMVVAQARTLIQRRYEIERIVHDALSANRDYQLLRMTFPPGDRSDQFPDDPRGGRRSASFQSSSPVSEVLRSRSRHLLVADVSWSNDVVEVWKCRVATYFLDGDVGRDPPARQQPLRQVGTLCRGGSNASDRRHKAMTALTAKMARVAHAVVKTGTEYRPFLERSDARWKDPSLQVP